MDPFRRFGILALLAFSGPAHGMGTGADCAATAGCVEGQGSSAAGESPAVQVAPPAAAGSLLAIPRLAAPPPLERFVRLAGADGDPSDCPESVCGVRVSDFRQREPGDGTPVSRATYAYLSYDDRNLYVVFVCFEEPGMLRARMVRREDIFSDDRVGVFLDTFNDRQRAYAFVANPFGIQLDGITTEGQGTDYSFDTLWHSQGRITSRGFVVWMAIPFRSLRFSGDSVQTWGISLGRLIPRNSEASYWPYVTRRKNSFVAQFARLEGLERISPGRNLQFIPYGLFARARTLAPGGVPPAEPGFVRETEARGGLDAKVVLRDAFTLDVALNPDFSHVESDEPQVTINQRFEVFFPEKRPFFIENTGFFQTRQNLFFTRRVVDPQFGARLTGKVNRWAIGLLAIDDRAPDRTAPTSGLAANGSGARAAIGVGRLQREFGRQSNAGMLITTWHRGDTRSTVYSTDTRISLDPNWFFSGQISVSDDRAADGARRIGAAGLAEIAHSGRHMRYFSRYVDRSPEFIARLGFVPRVDVRLMEHFADYTWRPEGRRLHSHGPSVYTLANWDRRNRVQDWIVRTGYGFAFTGQGSLTVEHTESLELFQELKFRKRVTGMSFETEWLSWLGFYSGYSLGREVNFFPAPGLAPFVADSTGGFARLDFRPLPQLRVEQSYIYSRLATGAEPSLAGVPANTSIFNNHLTRTRVHYQFTRELSLRAILDYSAVLPNSDLVGLERSKRLGADFLLTYLLNPGTALYVGYTDLYDNLALDPGSPAGLRRTRSPTTSTGRQFFVKMSYLLRF
jgi:hypothetical protein